MRHILLGLVVATGLSACGDPLRDVARLDDVVIADGAANVAETPAEARNNAGGGGLFRRMLNRQPDDPTNAAVEAALADTANAEDGDEETLVQTSASSTIPEPQEAELPRRGLRGLFSGNGRAERPRTGPDATDVDAGTVMPFGTIARVCGLGSNQLGTQIDGGGGFRIYDTIPQTTSPRPFYITGFDDNCARTFTGAVVVTGDIETHEFVRYQGSNEGIDYTTTDNAYEALKASECRVGRGQPCGERTERLNRDTHFITVYNFFGGTFSSVPTQWAQILVHDGEVLAMSLKDG
ncbi:hypothetical protein SAMN05444287_0202 [Octadecabacter temperatus]|uniref:Uncharacterized protein n=1 Tax=Octadecabacter temperatus TaxID=1458307 RepID=A0A0K0Y2F3_9RHOB|nr:hypothetical protein [Octadecabacter temperatus]AKS45114.1 hypothetical protein OSB_05510 [Octadecabacter temperatus]SIN86419.1 hypothetical protein SAMN05444287_0202 [Octadecabacter temperatus]